MTNEQIEKNLYLLNYFVQKLWIASDVASVDESLDAAIMNKGYDAERYFKTAQERQDAYNEYLQLKQRLKDLERDFKFGQQND